MKKTKSKLGFYVILALLAFYVYTIAYILVCFSINVQPSDFMCIAFAVVTGIEIIVTAVIKNGSGTVSRDDVAFVADIVGKVLNIEPPTLNSGNTGSRDETEDTDESTEESDEILEDEDEQQQPVG